MSVKCPNVEFLIAYGPVETCNPNLSNQILLSELLSIWICIACSEYVQLDYLIIRSQIETETYLTSKTHWDFPSRFISCSIIVLLRSASLSCSEKLGNKLHWLVGRQTAKEDVCFFKKIFLTHTLPLTLSLTQLTTVHPTCTGLES